MRPPRPAKLSYAVAAIPPESKPTASNKGAKVWTFRRQLMGNLLPLVAGLPFSLLGLAWVIRDENLLSPGLGLLALAVLVSGVSLNWLGSPINPKMKAEFLALYGPRLARRPPDRTFVGFARPGNTSLLDPHQDVGFLCLSDDAIEFVGELYQARVNRKDCQTIRFRSNPHSALRLGRWVSIEGVTDGRPFRLLVEPREKGTLFQNRRLGTELHNRLQVWRRAPQVPAPE